MLGILREVLLNIKLLAKISLSHLKMCHKAGTITCANNASYIIKGISQVHIKPVNGDVITLNNVFLCPWHKEKPFLVSAIAMHGYPIHFLYENAQYMIVLMKRNIKKIEKMRGREEEKRILQYTIRQNILSS